MNRVTWTMRAAVEAAKLMVLDDQGAFWMVDLSKGSGMQPGGRVDRIRSRGRQRHPVSPHVPHDRQRSRGRTMSILGGRWRFS